MWGALAVAADPRVTHFVYAAGTRSFTDWYLYTPKREGADKEAFIAKLAPLDPIELPPEDRAAAGPAAVRHEGSPREERGRGRAWPRPTKEPKTVKTYEGAEHELTFQARLDRLAWFREQFKLTK